MRVMTDRNAVVSLAVGRLLIPKSSDTPIVNSVNASAMDAVRSASLGMSGALTAVK